MVAKQFDDNDLRVVLAELFLRSELNLLGPVLARLLHRARLTAVPATRGAGLHPNREVWVPDPREAKRSGFVPKNKHRPDAQKAF
jgi:hypothetical protein